MIEEIHNLYISSSNKTSSDYNYNYNLYLSSYGIKIKEDEDAYLNINGFQTLNSFYNINNKSKSFIVKVTTDQDISFTYNYEIEEGNYNIEEFKTVISNLCSQHFSIEYNEKKNKWHYKAIDINNQIYIKPSIYNYKYFGLKPDVFNEIIYLGTYSSLINLNNFSLIIIKVIGLVEINKSIDNFSSLSRGDSTVIINRQDVCVNGLINWTNINNSFMKKISNLEINHLNFQFYNEFNQLLTDIDDWLLIMSIIIKKKNK